MSFSYLLFILIIIQWDMSYRTDSSILNSIGIMNTPLDKTIAMHTHVKMSRLYSLSSANLITSLLNSSWINWPLSLILLTIFSSRKKVLYSSWLTSIFKDDESHSLVNPKILVLLRTILSKLSVVWSIFSKTYWQAELKETVRFL